MFFVFPVLIPIVLLATLAHHRHDIELLMNTAYEHSAKQRYRTMSAADIAEREKISVSKTVVSLASKFEYYNPKRCASWRALMLKRVTFVFDHAQVVVWDVAARCQASADIDLDVFRDSKDPGGIWHVRVLALHRRALRGVAVSFALGSCRVSRRDVEPISLDVCRAPHERRRSYVVPGSCDWNGTGHRRGQRRRVRRVLRRGRKLQG